MVVVSLSQIPPHTYTHQANISPQAVVWGDLQAAIAASACGSPSPVEKEVVQRSGSSGRTSPEEKEVVRRLISITPMISSRGTADGSEDPPHNDGGIASRQRRQRQASAGPSAHPVRAVAISCDPNHVLEACW